MKFHSTLGAPRTCVIIETPLRITFYVVGLYLLSLPTYRLAAPSRGVVGEMTLVCDILAA